ncbi:MAG: TIGR01212 family radical SAM protein [Desulfosalsimonadaceae bacterium]
MKNPYYDLNTYFKNIFGHRVHKISIDAGMSCPNRDGRLSTSGCIYCNQTGSGTGFSQKGLSVTDQLQNAEAYVRKRFKAKKFIAYFQSFTNTYAPLDHLKHLYDEALAVEDVVGLSIGTRPDCVDGDILNLLQGYAEKYLVWIEYGLQSAHDRTLALINRGHDFKAFQMAVEATQNRGIHICVHVILGLPGESGAQMMETARILSRMGIDGLKLHLLYIIKGTEMEKQYREGTYACLTLPEYADLACEFLAYMPKNVVIQRLTSDPHPGELVAPLWALQKSEIRSLIRQTFDTRGLYQGKWFQP